MEIRDKVVILTGASMGIGEATAHLFAQQGAKLALAARSTDKLKALAEELAPLTEVIAITTDMTKPNMISAMVTTTQEHFGRIDVLINNAGQALHVPIERVNLDHYRQAMELNVYGPVVAMQAVIPVMRQQGGGMIVNISSGVSKNYFPGVGPYASTKYALNALSLTARAELAGDNIRVGIVIPGLVTNDFHQNAIHYEPPSRAIQANRPGGSVPTFTSEQVAEKVLEAVQTEVAEQYMSEAAKAAMTRS